MGQQWFVQKDGVEQGPFTAQKLKFQAVTGTLQPDDLVRSDSNQKWRPAKSVKGLFQTKETAGRSKVPPPLPSPKPVPLSPSKTNMPVSSKRLLIIVASIFGSTILLCCGGFGFMAYYGHKWTVEAESQFAEAETLWDKGEKAEALVKYRSLVSSSHFLSETGRSRLYGRLIDHEYESDRPDEGNSLIDKAVTSGVFPAVSHADAIVVVAAKKAEKERIEAEKERQKQLAEAEQKAEELEASRKKSKYTRDEFKRLVMHQTKDYVLEYLGKPVDTQGVGDMDLWYYDDITYDPITSDTDFRTQLMFEHGRVQNVNFL